MFDGLNRKVDDRIAGVFAELEAEADDDGAGIDVEQPRVDGDVEPNDEEKRLIKKLRKNMGQPASSWQDRFASHCARQAAHLQVGGQAWLEWM